MRLKQYSRKEENQSIYGLIKVTNIIANILKSYYKNNIILFSIENEEKPSVCDGTEQSKPIRGSSLLSKVMLSILICCLNIETV